MIRSRSRLFPTLSPSLGGALLALLVPLVFSAPARAADPAAQARELFQKGQKALDAGNSKDAVEAFEGAYKAGNAPSLLFYVGEAHRQAGNTAKALEAYQEYLAKMPNAPKKADAEAHIAELKKAPAKKEQAKKEPAKADAKPENKPAVAATPPPAPRAAPEVKAAPGTLAAAGRAAPAKTTMAPAGAVEAAPRGSGSSGGGMRTAGWVIGGVGVAALVAGGLFGLQAKNAADDVSAAAKAGKVFDPAVEDKGKRAQTLQYVCFGGGAAALVGGGVLLLLAPSAERRAALVPAAVPGGAMASLTLRY